MSIIDEYISQHFSERLNLDVTEDNITWQLRGSQSDYVNSRILFTREKLMSVMEVMLSGLNSDEYAGSLPTGADVVDCRTRYVVERGGAAGLASPGTSSQQWPL